MTGWHLTYSAAAAKGDKIGMATAHKKAEDARAGKIYKDKSVSKQDLAKQIAEVSKSKYVSKGAKGDLNKSDVSYATKSSRTTTERTQQKSIIDDINKTRKKSNLVEPRSVGTIGLGYTSKTATSSQGTGSGSLVTTSKTQIGPVPYNSANVKIKTNPESPIKFGEFSGTVGPTGGSGEWKLGIGLDTESKNQIIGINKLGIFGKQSAQAGVVVEESDGLQRISGGLEATIIGGKVECEVELLKSIKLYADAEIGLGAGGKGKIANTVGNIDFAMPTSLEKTGAGFGHSFKEGIGGGYYVQVVVEPTELIINGIELLQKLNGGNR